METGETRKRGVPPQGVVTRTLLRGLVATLVLAGPIGLVTARPASALELGDGHEVALGHAPDNYRGNVLDHLIEIGDDDGLEVDLLDLVEIELGDGLEVELLFLEVELGDDDD